MTQQTDYTLYELTTRKGCTNEGCSPFAWMTKADLALLKVAYTPVMYTFAEIRNDLAKATGNDGILVPTLKAGNEYVTDSFEIAEWLDAKHPGVLFPTPDARVFAYFVLQYTNVALTAEPLALFRPLCYLHFDAPSREYYLTEKNGPPQHAPRFVYEGLRALEDPKVVEGLAATARAKLGVLDRVLAKSGGPYFLGPKPSHADAILYGWYAFSQINPDINALMWHHESVPHIKAWSAAMEQAAGYENPYPTAPTPEKKAELMAELEQMIKEKEGQ